MDQFTIGNILASGFRTFARNYLGLLGVAFIYVVITSVPNVVMIIAGVQEDPLGSWGWLLPVYAYMLVMFGPAYAGLFYSGYQAFRGDFQVGHALAGFRRWIPCMLLSLMLFCVGFALGLAAAALMIPLAFLGPLVLVGIIGAFIAVIYFMVRVFLFPWIIVLDRPVGPIQAVNISWRITRGRVLNLSVAYIVLAIVVFMVTIPFLIPTLMAALDDPMGADAALQSPMSQMWVQLPGLFFTFPITAAIVGAAFGLIVGKTAEEEAEVFT